MDRFLNFLVLGAACVYAVGWTAMFVVGPMFLVYQLLRLCTVSWGVR